jgi:glycerate kinase
MSRVVIAPDSFKGSMSADRATAAIARGWASVRSDDLVLLPMADGGEGTVDAFAAAYPDAIRMPVTVTGPDDRPVETAWLLLPDGTGVVELAGASGLTLLDPLRPFDAHTLGFGQAIAAALDHGVDRLLLAIGGSSSTDGGAGALVGLGAQLLDAAGNSIALGNRGLESLTHFDSDALRAVPAGGAIVLSDVSSPLLGPLGAAAVFGPQKGASADDVAVLDANLARFAGVVGDSPSMPGAGAAGGAGYGLLAWGASISAGAGAIGDALGMPAAVASADLVITGEGRFDHQSAAGKVPSYLAGLAAGASVRSVLVAGLITAPTDEFDFAVSLTDLAGGSQSALRDAEKWLETAGAMLARQF